MIDADGSTVRIAGAVVCLGAIALASASCRSATQVVVDVTTDIDCSASATETSITVGRIDSLEQRPASSTTPRCANGRIGALVVVPSGSSTDELAIRVVTGIGKSAEACVSGGYTGGCIVARRALHFLPHEQLTVVVAMRAPCKDVACDANAFTTCVNGACVPGRVADSTQCEGAGCTENTLSPGDAGPPRDGGSNAAWRSMAPSGSAMPGVDGTVAVWAGDRMLVFGGGMGVAGFTNRGAAYDPKGDSWSALPTFPFLGRLDHAAVWTGSEMIVWGGKAGVTVFSDGARIAPTAASWTPLPSGGLSGRRAHSMVWDAAHGEVIVWGGDTGGSTNTNDGAAFRPASNTWRALPTPTLTPRFGHAAAIAGGKMIVVSGNAGSTFTTDGAIYDTSMRTWAPLPAPPASLDGRLAMHAFAGGAHGELAVFFGGGDTFLNFARSNGAIFDTTSGQWTEIPAPPASMVPTPDRLDPFVWFDGQRLGIWGGRDPANSGTAPPLAGGALYDIASRTWSPLPTQSEPSPRANGAAVWGASGAVLFGGYDIADMVSDKGAFLQY